MTGLLLVIDRIGSMTRGRDSAPLSEVAVPISKWSLRATQSITH